MGVGRSVVILHILMAVAGVLSGAGAVYAQGPASIRQVEQERYDAYGFEREEQWDSLFGRMPRAGLSMKHRSTDNFLLKQPSAGCPLDRIVFGWSPYWMGTSYTTYDYSLLSDVCYFSYEVDPATGGYRDIHNWKTTGLVPLAKANGTRVHLCVTLFSDHALLLENPGRRRTLIDSLVALVRLRDGNGVNIDFESVPGAQRANLTGFMAELANRFHTEIPGSLISIALPAVDWSNAFDVAAMVPYVDLFIIMGYDYYWRSSSVAGPVAPKNNGSLWSPYDAGRSILRYLERGIPEGKLSLGVPYYGYDWPTADSTLGSATTGPGVAVRYKSAQDQAARYGRRWDTHSSSPYYIYRADGIWHQTWYEDAESLGLKYDLVLSRNLAGIGIWALGYEDDRREPWDVIASRYTACAFPCTGTITDMGGPNGNYFDNDSYTFTIAPLHASSVALSFYSFNIADDRLRIYDGRDTTAPLIGTYSGTQSPGIVTAKSGAMTLKFVSNGSTTSWGWIATWSCATQPQSAPVESEAVPTGIDIHVRPNPHRGDVTIGYELERASRVDITIVDMLGKLVAQRSFDRQAAGVQEITFGAAELQGSSDACIVRVAMNGATKTGMIVRVR